MADDIEIRIESPDSQGVGEIVVRHPNMFLGYYKNPEASAADMKDGWMLSGDAGYFNATRQLVVIDRIKDLAETSRGERFSPQYIENKLKFSPYIAEAVVLGAGRDALAAMICIRYSIISKWAEKNRIAFTTYTDLASRAEVYALLRKEVETVNATLPPAQRISRFLLLYKELDADDGELTRTRKVRRGVINEKYGDIIDAIYRGVGNIPVDTVIRFQDGSTQRVRTSLRVVDLAARPYRGGRGVMLLDKSHCVHIECALSPCGRGQHRCIDTVSFVRGPLSAPSMRTTPHPASLREATLSRKAERVQARKHEHRLPHPAPGQRPRGRHALWRGRDVVRADLQGDASRQLRAGRIAADRRLGLLGCCSTKFQVPFWLGMPLTLVFMFVFGIAIQIVILRPMIGEPIISVIMVTIGLSTVFQAALKWIFGVNPQPFPRVFQNQSRRPVRPADPDRLCHEPDRLGR